MTFGPENSSPCDGRTSLSPVHSHHGNGAHFSGGSFTPHGEYVTSAGGVLRLTDAFVSRIHIFFTLDPRERRYADDADSALGDVLGARKSSKKCIKYSPESVLLSENYRFLSSCSISNTIKNWRGTHAFCRRVVMWRGHTPRFSPPEPRGEVSVLRGRRCALRAIMSNILSVDP